MKARSLALGIAAAALLVSCRGDDDGFAFGPQTTTSIARSQIAAGMPDTATPIDLNAASISDADTDDASVPFPVN